MTDVIARRVYYEGRVQGVGFRATAAWIARQFAVAGSVRNLADGRVLLFAEGAPDQVESFLQAIRERFKKYVESEHIEEQTLSGEESGFKIIH
ncbi:MAG: acylphosphatase [Gemmataceae bacterium]